MKLMADGTVKIKIEVDGKQVDLASRDLTRLEDAGHRGGKGAKQAEDGMRGVGQESSKASGNIKKFATSLGLVAVGAMAFSTLKGSMDAAISRFDTLNQFPKVLQELGVSAEDSEKAMQDLSDGIDGLPTKLDEIASTAQRMYTSFNDMDKATDSALALNNALLGSGSSSEQASRGTEQYLKVLQTGQMDLMTWRSLSETMDVGLVKLAESFGYAGKTAKDDLYRALQDGTITIDDFNDKLIEIGTGTGVMAKLAKENSLGLATSLTNLKTAVSRNVANVIESFNNLVKEVTGDDIAVHLDGLKHVVNSVFKVITGTIEGAAPVVKVFLNVLKALMPVVEALTPLLAGLAATYISLLVITKVSAGVSTLMAVFKSGTVIIVAKTAAVSALRVALTALSGPVGWVSAGIGAVVTGSIALIKWFNRSSKEAEKLNKKTEELADANDQLADSVESSSKSYENSKGSIETTAKANQELIKQIDELSQKENKSAADKKLLQSYVEDLNGSIEDLNLVYGEETDALSMSSEQLMKRVELMQEEEKMIASQERLKETIEEQIEIGKQLDEVNEMREEWNEKLEDGSVKTREHTKAMVDLDEQHEELMETMKEATEERIKADEELTESAERVANMTDEAIGRQMLMYEELSDAQKNAVDGMKDTWQDYYESATDMFDQLSDEAVFTIDEMTKNLEENQRIIGEWADGIAELAERGVDQGLLDKLREAGPESAGHVNALVNASDEELQKLSTTFQQGGETATDALSSALDIDKTEIMDKLGHLVVDTEKSLREKVRDADFESIGVDVVHGMAGGIDEKVYEAENAAREMAEDVIDSTQKTLGIASPSKVFKGFGGDVTKGMELGISSGTSKVLNTARKLFRSTISEFKDFKDDFNRVGQDAMAGLNAGLNAGRQRVLNTARSIANQAAATMQNALRIHSPSRVFRDDIGKMIPEGIAVGIEDNASSVFNVIDDLSNKMVKFRSPELALGQSMSHVGQASNVVNNISNTQSKPGGRSDSLLAEQNEILRAILQKDPNIYADGKKITDLVNDHNAVDELGKIF